MAIGEMGGFSQLAEGQGTELMQQLHDLKPEDPGVVVDYRLAEGDTAEEILRTARETNSDVIVLGTHGRKGLGRLLLGSVAEQTVRTAPCPVVTVKPASRKGPERNKAAQREMVGAGVCSNGGR